MIIDKGYDIALWCILSADKKNRPKVVEFIKSIPQELFTKINNGILQLKKSEKSESYEEFDLYDSVDVDEDIEMLNKKLAEDLAKQKELEEREKND